MKLPPLKNKELLSLVTVVILSVVFAIFSLSINLLKKVYGFFGAYSEASYLDFFINFILVYLSGLLWLIYSRWKKSEKAIEVVQQYKALVEQSPEQSPQQSPEQSQDPSPHSSGQPGKKLPREGVHINVIYTDGTEEIIPDFIFERLLQLNKVKQFYRYSESRWVNVGVDPIRRSWKKGRYKGIERRKPRRRP